MENNGFLKNLFDASFSEFLTTKIISVIYIIGIIFCGIVSLIFLFSGDQNFLVRLIAAPIAFFLYVILLRIWLEVVMVIFKIADNTDKMVAAQSSESTYE
ncbi:MAG: DUF4282 domain-containing protein [Candidatus Neomarinimicrobiota bacterium]